MLERERSLYAAHKEEWEKKFPGKILLIKGEELVGAFNTMEEALSEGARLFGVGPYLARPVNGEPEISIPALTLGLLNAASSRPV